MVLSLSHGGTILAVCQPRVEDTECSKDLGQGVFETRQALEQNSEATAENQAKHAGAFAQQLSVAGRAEESSFLLRHTEQELQRSALS